MKGFSENIEQLATENTHFRHVLYTAKHCQLVLMSLQPDEEIGTETHTENDQFFRFESGNGIVKIDNFTHQVSDGSVVIVPAGAVHNVINTSAAEELKFYTIYMPPHHKDGIVRATREEAMADEEDFDGVTTESLNS